MAAPSAQGPPGPDEDPARRPDEPGGDPSPDERVDWRPGEMSEEDREAWLDGLAADPRGHGRSGPRRGDRRATGDHRGAGHDRRLVRATRAGPTRVGPPVSRRGLQPGGCIRDRAGPRCDAGLSGAAGFADQAAGADDSFGGASDDELLGVPCAWDRVEAHATARKR